MTVNEKVGRIQENLKRDGLDAYIIYGSDPHNSEYVCPRWRTRNYVSGFSGSAGTVMITVDEAFLWVDSRYHIQGEAQVKGTCFKLFKESLPGVPFFNEFLSANREKYPRIGTSADCLMKNSFDRLSDEGFTVVPTYDYLDDIWTDRPEVPHTAVTLLSDALCGETAAQKIAKVRKWLGKRDYTFISSLDDIAWILNLRGSDIDYNPVFLSYLLIGQDKAVLFADRRRFSDSLFAYLSSTVEIRPYENVRQYLSTITDATVVLDYKRTNMLVYNAFGKGVVFENRMDCTTELKGCKNDAELQGMKKAHLYDGAAFANFMGRVEEGNLEFTEIGISTALEEERAKMPSSLGPSFGPISGFGAHGAIVHYSADEESSCKIERGLLVLDTGGHYDCGMTDITRTLCFGEPTDEEKRNYTLVLKGHLALYAAVFPEGTSGMQLDVLAKQHLWKYGLTYNHGTGHGVGFHLCVHEGPMSISPRPTANYPLKSGMVISDEPGVYLENRHGIRIENLVYVLPAFETEFGKFLKFGFLTMVPYERSLIDVSLLSAEEISLINAYHKEVFESLKDMVTPSGLKYLEKATAEL